MIEITFYTTAGCHLCDLAYDMLFQMDVVIHQVEIGDNDDLVTQYGTTIPVIKFADNSELNWPFEQLEIEDKLRQSLAK